MCQEGPDWGLGRPTYRAQSVARLVAKAARPSRTALPAPHRPHPLRLRPASRGPGQRREHRGPPRARRRRFSFKTNPPLDIGGSRPELGQDRAETGEAGDASLRTAAPRNACREQWFQRWLPPGARLLWSSKGLEKWSKRAWAFLLCADPRPSLLRDVAFATIPTLFFTFNHRPPDPAHCHQ